MCHCGCARGGDAELAEVQQVVILHSLCFALPSSLSLCDFTYLYNALCDIIPAACIVPCVILLISAVLLRVPCLILLHPRVPSALGEPVHCSLNAACERPNPMGWSSSFSLPSSSGYCTIFRCLLEAAGEALEELSPRSNPKKNVGHLHICKKWATVTYVYF